MRCHLYVSLKKTEHFTRVLYIKYNNIALSKSCSELISQHPIVNLGSKHVICIANSILPYETLLQPCPLPTTAWSVQKMASAQNTKSSVPYTQRSSTTSKTTRDTLRNVSSAIADRLRGASRSSTIGDSVDVRAVDDITDVSLLAHGGYNSIWLVKLRAQLEVKCNLLFL